MPPALFRSEGGFILRRQTHTSILDSGRRIQKALEGCKMKSIETCWEALAGNPGCMEVMETEAKVKVLGMKKARTREILRQQQVGKYWVTPHRVSKSGEASRMMLCLLTWAQGLA